MRHAPVSEDTPVIGDGPVITTTQGPTTAEDVQVIAEQIRSGDGSERTSLESQISGGAKELGAECFAWVQRYRRGQCSRNNAFSAITDALIGSNFELATVGSSLRTYKIMLDTSRATNTTEHTDSREEGSNIKDNGQQSTLTSPPHGVASELRSASNQAHQVHRRSQEVTGATEQCVSGSSDSDDDNEDLAETGISPLASEPAAKRQRLETRSNDDTSDLGEASYPWESFHRSVVPLSVEQRRTKDLLDEWNKSDQSFKRAFKRLTRMSGLPRFPRSQLKHVLAGEFVDFDKVYASVNSLVAESNIRARISDSVSIELEGEVTSSRQTNARVTDQASYTVAANLLLATMLFIFGEYRRNELTGYFTHVQTMFSSLSPSHHGCVINYDKAVRLFIAQSNDVAFDDFSKFTHLERANLHPLGINVATDFSIARAVRDRQPGSRKRSGRPIEICRNFNAGRCVKAPNECQYRHICSTCHRSGHSAKDSKCSDMSLKMTAAA